LISRKRILVWADDVPNNNSQLVKVAKDSGITVYQPVTTKQTMDLINTNFNDWQNASVRVITDMFRIEENGAEAKYAGEDLIRAMVLKGYNYPILCFTSSNENITRLQNSYPHVLAVKDNETCTRFALFQTSEKAIMDLGIKFEQLYLELKEAVNTHAPELALVDKKSLVNPLRNWHDSPSHRVAIKATKEAGYIVGWEMVSQSYIDRTGKLVLEMTDKKFKTVDPSELETDNMVPRPPWTHPEVKVWRSKHVADIFKGIFAEKIEGMDVTFRQVFDVMLGEGVCVFVVGGAIRDSIIGKKKEEIKDIDMGFGCSAKNVKNIATKHNWWKSNYSISPFGMVQLGDTSKELYLEGKSINGINSDRVRIPNVPTTTSSDLFAENIYRDFSCNALWYDPFNEVIVDPTGHGVEDSLKKILRIPIEKAKWDEWLDGNPTKIYRYWKFRARGYAPADSETKDYLTMKAKDVAKKWTDWDCKVMLQKGVMGGKSDSINRLKMQAFRDSVKDDMGIDFYNTYFKKHEL